VLYHQEPNLRSIGYCDLRFAIKRVILGAMNKKTAHLKPQDIYVLLKLSTVSEQDWRMVDVACELGISQSEVSQGLVRLQVAKLVDGEKKSPLRNNLYEFLIHGLKYAFPPVFGPVQRGVPTAHSAPPISCLIKSGTNSMLIWPWPDGEARGETLLPLYPSVPGAAIKDPILYELLALVDAVRVGRAREQKIASRELEKRILKQR